VSFYDGLGSVEYQIEMDRNTAHRKRDQQQFEVHFPNGRLTDGFFSQPRNGGSLLPTIGSTSATT
jgi:hypothetical protein